MIKDILIISVYENGYGFSTYYNGIYNDNSINIICSSYWEDCKPDDSFKRIRVKLYEIGITPTHIIACADGSIYLEK